MKLRSKPWAQISLKWRHFRIIPSYFYHFWVMDTKLGNHSPCLGPWSGCWDRGCTCPRACQRHLACWREAPGALQQAHTARGAEAQTSVRADWENACPELASDRKQPGSLRMLGSWGVFCLIPTKMRAARVGKTWHKFPSFLTPIWALQRHLLPGTPAAGPGIAPGPPATRLAAGPLPALCVTH